MAKQPRKSGRRHNDRRTTRASAASKPPRIVAFCCENSGWLAAEALHGNTALKGVQIVKVPCAGRVEAKQMLACLERGARQVLVVGCPLDNCKYVHGNRRTLKRAARARAAVRDAGLDENAIRMELISSVDSQKLLEILKEIKRA